MYTLIAFFLLTGQGWVEQEHLSLQGCAGQAAMSRTEFLVVQPKLNKVVGDVRFLCVPERANIHRD